MHKVEGLQILFKPATDEKGEHDSLILKYNTEEKLKNQELCETEDYD